MIVGEEVLLRFGAVRNVPGVDIERNDLRMLFSFMKLRCASGDHSCFTLIQRLRSASDHKLEDEAFHLGGHGLPLAGLHDKSQGGSERGRLQKEKTLLVFQGIDRYHSKRMHSKRFITRSLASSKH